MLIDLLDVTLSEALTTTSCLPPSSARTKPGGMQDCAFGEP